MAPQLTGADVARLAELAALDLPAADRDAFARQLSDIVAHAAVVRQVDTSSVEAAAAAELASPIAPIARADTPTPSLDRAAALASAPEADAAAGLMRVPRVR